MQPSSSCSSTVVPKPPPLPLQCAFIDGAWNFCLEAALGETGFCISHQICAQRDCSTFVAGPNTRFCAIHHEDAALQGSESFLVCYLCTARGSGRRGWVCRADPLCPGRLVEATPEAIRAYRAAQSEGRLNEKSREVLVASSAATDVFRQIRRILSRNKPRPHPTYYRNKPRPHFTYHRAPKRKLAV